MQQCKREYSDIILEMIDVDNCTTEDLKRCSWNSVLFEDVGLAERINKLEEENGLQSS